MVRKGSSVRVRLRASFAFDPDGIRLEIAHWPRDVPVGASSSGVSDAAQKQLYWAADRHDAEQ
jgi:hypothetical protein